MVKVAAVNVSVDREERVAGQLIRQEEEEEPNSCSSSTLDVCLKIKVHIFSGDDLIYESPINPISIRSISLPSHSNIQNPTLLRSTIESGLSSLNESPELLCARDLLLRPIQILDEHHPVCIIDLVAQRVASSSLNNSNSSFNSNSDLFGMFHFVAHVEIVSVLTGIAPQMGLIFKRDLKKFNAIGELKKQAFHVASSSSSSSSAGNQEEVVVGDCSICLQDLSDTGIDLIRLPNCSHVFHLKCILPWLKKSDCCPLCRDLCLQKS